MKDPPRKLIKTIAITWVIFGELLVTVISLPIQTMMKSAKNTLFLKAKSMFA